MFSYLHYGEKSVEQIDGLHEGLSAVAKETGQAPQFFHFAVSALCRHSAGNLQRRKSVLILSALSVKMYFFFLLMGHLWGCGLHQVEACFPGEKAVLLCTA